MFKTFCLLGETAVNLTISKARLCPQDYVQVNCSARNTSLIEWSINRLVTVTCYKNDPPVHNISVDGIRIFIQTNYFNQTSVLNCDFKINARELPKNQPLFYTCQNVDIGVTAARSFEVEGTHNS